MASTGEPRGEPIAAGDEDPAVVTLRSYQAAAQRYIDRSPPAPAPDSPLTRLLDGLAELAGGSHVLELGCGGGRDALALEQRGLTVTRTDATPAFVEHMRAAGHEARLLDVRSDELGGPYDAVLANAVLLHLGRAELERALQRIRSAVGDTGLLAVTLKEGDGARWSTAKIGLPRHFTYWREPALRELLTRTGWAVVSLEHGRFADEPWLCVLARATSEPSSDGLGAADLERAIAFAGAAHRGQLYPAPRPEPYVLHLFRVMLAVQGLEAQLAAVLHDVIEDTDATAEDLRRAGFPEAVVDAVVLLTHRSQDSYERYIERVAGDALARVVKLADLADNLANNRRLSATPGVTARIDRYERAERRLQRTH